MSEFVAYNATAGLIVFGAVGFASCFKGEERTPAILCAITLAYVWLCFVLCWTPYSLALMLRVSTVDLWAFNDLLAGAVVYLIARRFVWGLMLYGMFVAEAACHVLWWLHAVPWGPYKQALDFTFYLEEALFFVIGGTHALDSLAGARFRGVRFLL